jgi:hypothetical protein
MAITQMIRRRSKATAKTPQIGAAAKTEESCMLLDYPQEDEKITTPHYTFRIGAIRETARVEISIDKGPWRACRPSAGYWWYDWSNYNDGPHQALAKAHEKEGHALTSAPRRFQVSLAVSPSQG